MYGKYFRERLVGNLWNEVTARVILIHLICIYVWIEQSIRNSVY